MRNLQRTFDDCIQMMDEIGIDYGYIKSVTVNTRAKGRWGQCRSEFKGWNVYGDPTYSHTINISSILLDERTPLEALQSTIIHEILHTCPGCQNHGRNWEWRAEKVKRELGYKINVAESADDKAISSEVIKDYNKPKYKVRCKKCGREVGKYRMCKIIKYPENWRCGKCGGDFERIM